MKKQLLLVIFLAACFISGYVGVTQAWPGVAARTEWHGYFRNQLDTSGANVWDLGIPAGVATGVPGSQVSFMNYVEAKLNDTGADQLQNRVGAVFIIKTMLGIAPGTAVSVTPAELTEWRSRVNYASAQGWISYNTVLAYTVNSYYQGNPPIDDAFFYESGASSAIIFRNGSGTILYAIRRQCANPVGNLSALVDPPNFNLTPSVNLATPTGTPITGPVEPGDTVVFRFVVTNTGPSSSSVVNCSIYGNTFSGYSAQPPVPRSTSSGGYVPPGSLCPMAFWVGAVTITTESVVAAANQTICRSLFVTPGSSASPAARGDESCVVVANKPYAKMFGGDIAAGSGLETAPDVCTNNTTATIVGWNKRSAGGFAGAGTQYAALALDAITDFSTAQNIVGATEPSDLAFTNQGTDAVNGLYGGNFDSLPCIPDYYGTKPAATTTVTSPINVSPMVSGAYSATGQTTISGGNVNSNNRVSLFVDGDVYISGNITYSGSWTTGNIPLFELVARGNIYVSPSVTQLDGVFIAQRNGASGGTLYTCTDPAAPFIPLSLSNTLYSVCDTKLTVNGSVVANSIRLLRTIGTLRNSATTDARNSANIAEVFNYSPTAWIAQPRYPDPGATDSYDSIASLPPIL